MEDRIKLLAVTLGEERVKQDADLKEHLETRLGGVADAFYIATTTRELTRVIELCRELKIKYMVIGSGSKVALADRFPGLVIKNRSDSLRIFGIKGKVSREGIGVEEAFVEADSGTSLIKLADFAKSQGLGGLEVLAASPGTVGGSIHILPTIREKTYQVKVLSKSGAEKVKELSRVEREDLIISVTFKLKARK